jgi:hypothetical protein
VAGGRARLLQEGWLLVLVLGRRAPGFDFTGLTGSCGLPCRPTGQNNTPELADIGARIEADGMYDRSSAARNTQAAFSKP